MYHEEPQEDTRKTAVNSLLFEASLLSYDQCYKYMMPLEPQHVDSPYTGVPKYYDDQRTRSAQKTDVVRLRFKWFVFSSFIWEAVVGKEHGNWFELIELNWCCCCVKVKQVWKRSTSSWFWRLLHTVFDYISLSHYKGL